MKAIVVLCVVGILFSCSSNRARLYADDFFLLEKTNPYSVAVYQFQWSRAFDGLYLISVRQGESVAPFLKVEAQDKFGGFRRSFQRALTEDEAEDFYKRVYSLGFWSSVSPKNKDFEETELKCSFQSECEVLVQLDGSVWRIDALHNGNRHTVEALSPKSGLVREIGEYFIHLAGDQVRGDVY